VVITAGSEANHRIIEKNKHIPVYSNDYGPTEGTVCATFWKYEGNEALPERIPIGKPISNKKIYIVNNNTLCGIGVPGELCIAGEGLARGYLNRPELTEEKFVKNPFGEGRMYHTGDLARWLSDGNIEYLGRIDEQVKIRGFRVELGEIESRIREINNVTDCAVIAREDASGEKAVYAYVVSGEEISMSMIREELSKSLPGYMVPSYMMQIENIPVTKNGKLDKRALPDVEVISIKEYVAPRNKIEKNIAKVFEKVLNISKVGIYDDYFEIGGNSIKSIRISTMLRENNYDISVKDIYTKKTIAEIAKLLETQSENNDIEESKVKVSPFDIAFVYESSEDIVLNESISKVISDYINNIKGKKVVRTYKPNFIQKEFIINSYESSKTIGTGLQISGITLDKLKNELLNLVRDQDIFRTCYSHETEEMLEYEYGAWDIPVISYEQAKDRKSLAMYLKSFKTITGLEVLPRILIVEISDDTFEVYMYVHHALWDRTCGDVVTELLESYLNDRNVSVPQPTYNEYVSARMNSKRHMLSSEDLSYINEIFVKQRNSINNGKTGTRMFTLNIKREDGVIYDKSWILSKYNEITDNISDGRIGFMSIHHGRNENSIRSLGVHIDYVPGVYNTRTGIVEYYDELCEIIQQNPMPYSFLCNDIMPNIETDVVSLNMYDSVDYDLYENINEVKLIDIQNTREEIGVVSYNKMVSIDMMFSVHGETDEEILQRIKKAFSISNK